MSNSELLRHALVIGNNVYHYLPELRTAVADARAVAATLRSAGITVSEHIDADRRTLLRARSAFAEQIRAGGVGIVWFSGHGVQLLGRNILLPVDAEVDNEHVVRDEGIDLDDLIEFLTAVAPQILIVIVDACRTNPFPEARFRALIRSGLGNPRDIPSGVLVVYSAGPNEPALDNLGPTDSNPNGLFAREVIPLLTQPGVPLTTLVRQARSAIREKAVRFTGREQVPHISDRLIPDFVLISGEIADKSLATLANADKILHEHANVIKKLVFPHRITNPIRTEDLLALFRHHTCKVSSEEEFSQILSMITDRNIIPGLIYDGWEAYLLEEHAKWKAEIEHEKKARIGRMAASLIKNKMKIFLDAGSTNEEIAKIIIRRIENRALSSLTIASTSINIVDMISDSCVRMGFDDEFSAVRLYVPGGQVRPNTQAIVSAFNDEPRQIVSLGRLVGGFDIGFVGVNGIDAYAGFTTHTNAEVTNKFDIMAVCYRTVIVGDSSKVGIVLDQRFGGFDDDVTLIIDDNPENERLQRLIVEHCDKILRAR